MENPKRHGKSYNKWLGDQAKPSNRELLRVAIDTALAQKPADFDAFLKLLREAGYEVELGKVPSLRGKDQKRFIRLDSLGSGYDEAELRAVLAGEKTHKPRKKIIRPTSEKQVNLLVDIQAKLRAGKGAGYERWAKVFNLKQMAQTVNFLTENNLLEYAELEEKAAAATARFNELSAQIKATETRMTEIGNLKTHIINYSKTRDVYTAYRKAGYSKKFYAAHEGDLLLHKAAKQAFDALHVKKLPTVKSLQSEYETLLAEKRKTYSEYTAARKEMRELLRVKANVDQILNREPAGPEKENERGQR
ncbi:MAG TPA: relaxase/mobilization nuclease [Firmicutes bacterium]|nr:relaxase/mobilization nuclease [Bacillota bacterium]